MSRPWATQFNNNSSGNSPSKSSSSEDGDEAADDVSSDPAATHLPFALLALDQLYGIGCAKTGVRWDLITNLDAAGDAGQLDLSGTEVAMQRRRQALEKKKNTKSSKAGKGLLKAIGQAETVGHFVSYKVVVHPLTIMALYVVSELNVERTKSRNMKDSWKEPKKDSKQVSDWQATVKKSRKDVQKLDTKRKALTSRSRNPPVPGVNVQAATSSGSKTASQMAVKAASFKVSTARKMYESSMNSADTAKNQLVAFQNQMTNVKADLDALADSKLTLVSWIPPVQYQRLNLY